MRKDNLDKTLRIRGGGEFKRCFFFFFLLWKELADLNEYRLVYLEGST